MDWSLDNTGFHLHQPQRLRPWYNYISNPDYGLKLSHLGIGYAATVQEPRVIVTHHDPWSPVKGRWLYVKDNDTLWSPSYLPVKTQLDAYRCTHAPGYTEFNSTKNELSVQSRHFLPRQGRYEIWLIRVCNESKKTKSIMLAPQVELLMYADFRVDAAYYAWFLDANYDDSQHCIRVINHMPDHDCIFNESRLGMRPCGFFMSLTRPDAWEANLNMFLGNSDPQQPQALLNGQLSGSQGGGDPYIGAFQFNVTLKPGESKEFACFIGVGEDTIQEIKSQYPDLKTLHQEFDAIQKHWKEKLHKPELVALKRRNHSPTHPAQYYFQTFLPYQIYQQAIGVVREGYRGVRDVCQDAMGLCYFDPRAAREILLTATSKQMANGRCLRQWSTTGHKNDERDFRDLPLWLPVAIAHYIHVTGDQQILDEPLPFLDDQTRTSVRDHIIRGITYVLEYGPNDLLHVGAGDWNDALSGLGPRGESIWLNQFAYYALNQIRPYLTLKKTTCLFDIDAELERLYEGVQRQWTGQWFARAIAEDGHVIGGPERIFLLPQAWFVLSGMSQHDPERARVALDSMVNRLGTDYGLKLCDPPYLQFDPHAGRLSILAPGVAENSSVYNHASVYGVRALLQFGRHQEGLHYLNCVLPYNKDWKQTRAEPYVLVNYYNGGHYPHKAGDAGLPWLTSTVSWLAMAYFEDVLGQGIELPD